MSEFEWATECSTQEVPIEHQELGRIWGRVLDPEGCEVAGLRLWVLTAREYDMRMEGISLSDNEAHNARGRRLSALFDEFKLDGPGRYEAFTTTDSMGHFEFKGLRKDEFVVRMPLEKIVRPLEDFEFGHAALLTVSPVSSVGAALELSVARPALFLRVLEARGNPAAFTQMGDDQVEAGFPEVWPPKRTLLFIQDPATAWADRGVDLLTLGQPMGLGEAIYYPAPGARYFAVLLQPESSALIQPIAIPRGAGKVELQLQAPANTGLGQVSIHVSHPVGTPVPKRIEFRILEANTGIGLLEQKWLEPSDGSEVYEPIQLGLPQGSYLLRLRSCEESYGYHGTFISFRPFGDSLTPIEVRRGASTEVHARFSQPAQLHLTLEGSVQASDLAGAKALTEPMLHRGIVNDELRSRHASLRLVPADGNPIPLRFPIMAQQNSSAFGMHLLPLLPLGESVLSEPVTAGHYVLEASMLGGRFQSQAVELIAGETLHVTLEF